MLAYFNVKYTVLLESINPNNRLTLENMKVYVDNNNTIVFICPYCGLEKYIDLNNITKKILNIKCKCTKITVIELEYRQYFRKPIVIVGKAQIKNFNANIMIIDLSIQGLKFNFISKLKLYDQINIDDVINISFALNEHDILKKCKIKNKYDKNIGVQFMDENYSRNIGFYLM